MRVLIKAFYGKRNLGDDLILARFFQWAKDRSLTLSVASCGGNLGEENSDVYGGGYRVVSDSFLSCARELMSVDALILGAGGLFPSDSPRAMASKFLLVFISWLLKKPIYFVGLGVNPVKNTISVCMWKLIVRMVDLITVRDVESFETLRKVGGRAAEGKLECCEDVVFSLDVLNELRKDKKSLWPSDNFERLCVFAVAQPWSESERLACKERYIKFKGDMVGLIRQAIDRGYSVILVPFFLPGDRAIADEISAEFTCGVHVERSDLILDRVRHFGRATVVVAMRFHSLVLASYFSIPSLIVSYDHKLEALAKKVDAAENSVRLGIRRSEFFNEELDLDELELQKKFDYILKNQSELELNIEDKAHGLICGSNRNFELLNFRLLDLSGRQLRRS